VSLGGSGADLQALGVFEGTHGLGAEDVTEADFDVAEAGHVVLLQGLSQFLTERTVGDEVRAFVIRDDPGHIEEHLLGVEHGEVVRSVGTHLENAHLQALKNGIEAAVLGAVIDFDLEMTIGALFKISLEKFEGLTFRMGGDVRMGNLDDGCGFAGRHHQGKKQTSKSKNARKFHKTSKTSLKSDNLSQHRPVTFRAMLMMLATAVD